MATVPFRVTVKDAFHVKVTAQSRMSLDRMFHHLRAAGLACTQEKVCLRVKAHWKNVFCCLLTFDEQQTEVNIFLPPDCSA